MHVRACTTGTRGHPCRAVPGTVWGRDYRTAGNIGGQLNLAVWRLGKRPSNLNPSNLSAIYACACTHIICTELPLNLNPPIFLFRPLGTKPSNLKIANISGYTVYRIMVGVAT